MGGSCRMTITTDTIIEFAKIIGALGTIFGLFYAITKWVQAPKELSKDVKELHDVHASDIREIQQELCVLSYAMLASLDGLKQLNCNGEVTNAHKVLEKHINKKAHEWKENTYEN